MLPAPTELIDAIEINQSRLLAELTETTTSHVFVNKERILKQVINKNSSKARPELAQFIGNDNRRLRQVIRKSTPGNANRLSTMNDYILLATIITLTPIRQRELVMCGSRL